MTETLRLPASFRHPSGFLFRRDGVIYCQGIQPFQKLYLHLMESSLYEDLTKRSQLVLHDEVKANPLDCCYVFKIFKPKEINFISYPQEWCGSQLKDAALTTLQIQRRALEHGMTLKDGNAHNIQFH